MTVVPGFLPYALGGWLFLVGLYGVITSRNLIHQVICLSVVQTSTYVVILAVGYRAGAAAPIFYDIPNRFPAVDPVVAALTLTDVVVEATVTAVLLALAVQAQKRFQSLDPERLSPLRG
ncbi:MAG: NADH-quinone oxidoreductase subunit K [Candidatus Dormibacteraeota bacterium]|nr:NADH-quinone oxidoreductase subunit K [Candidatus Dormibacteraeota bacterium]